MTLHYQLRKLLTAEENQILAQLEENAEVVVFKDIHKFVESTMTMRDIFISKTQQIKMFRNAERLFGNIHTGYINRYETEEGEVSFTSTAPEVYKNDRKAVLVRSKTVINNSISTRQQLCLYIPKS